MLETFETDDVVGLLAPPDERFDRALLNPGRVQAAITQMVARRLHDAFADVDASNVVPALREPCDHVARTAPDVHDRALLNPSCDQVTEGLGAKIGASRLSESDLLPF